MILASLRCWSTTLQHYDSLKKKEEEKYTLKQVLHFFITKSTNL